MDKQPLIDLVNTGNSSRKIARHFGIGQSTVRYWLKKYGLKTSGRYRGNYRCLCGETDKGKFYKPKRYLCSRCFNQQKAKRGIERRLWIIARLGGKCSNPDCEFDKFSCSF